ncbi:DUF2290 domain-containing protein [Porifericola rhodea]|uniref:DUF2290 domain-containing protein n=1 Tax=Porifericola rhodea TaxID=930972 RepID=UPI00266657AB|nr:DUF2290 domain-containing protein [Porifericola rhodea]WKN31363.1 DUF2290 domain-containing protein [Porifericola rhodea]
MNLAKFVGSLKEAQKLLKDYELLISVGEKVIHKDDVSQEFKKASQSKDYFNLYRVATQNFDYDILMYDESIFQFSYSNLDTSAGIPEVRYMFLQNPQLFLTYNQYLTYLKDEGYIDEEEIETVGSSFYEEYQQYLNEQQVNTSNTSIRYDVDSKLHKPLVHSTAHFHFGHVTNVRVPCNQIVTPLGFVLFVLKHIYYTDWKEKLIKSEFIIEQLKKQKAAFTIIKELNENKWVLDEEMELFIN